MDNAHVSAAFSPDIVILENPTFHDERGFFREIERRADLVSVAHRQIQHAQWNHSRSRMGVLRGIHAAEWSKCVYVVRGNAQVVIVDLRPHSTTFGQHQSIIIGESQRAAIFVPPGCGNSFLALDEWVDFLYSVDAVWYPQGEIGVAWDDPDLAIEWQIKAPTLSERDRRNPSLRELFPERFAPVAANMSEDQLASPLAPGMASQLLESSSRR